MDLAPHINAFSSFAQSHFSDNDEDNTHLRMKLKHSLHVLENAREITVGESISGHTADLCHLSALYHDVGRFPQLVRYKTFNDRKSANHARLGVLALRGMDIPGTLSDRDLRTIRFAVAQHNVKTIRSPLPDDLQTPTQVVRDADKIDIFRVMIENFSSKTPDPTVTHGFENIPGYYTRKILDNVMAGQPGDYSLIRCANDFKLLLIGWLNDLHFSTSITLLAKRGHVESIFSFLPKDDNIKRLEEKTTDLIHYKSS